MADFQLNAKVGNDIGNSEQDLMIDGELISQPNVFSRVLELPALIGELEPKSVIKNLEDNMIVTIDSPILDKGIYYSGNYSLTSGKPISNIEVGADNNKVKSDVTIVNTLAQIAGYGTKLLFEKDPELFIKLFINVDMAISIPVTYYNPANAKKLIERFGGSHNVLVHVGARTASIEVVFDYIKVMPESVSIIFYLMSRLNGDDIFEDFNTTYNMNIDGSYFSGKKVLHVAIGEGTSEYPITTDLNFNMEFINGSNNGIGHAIEVALPKFKQAVSLRTFTRQNYSNILRDANHKYHDIAIQHLQAPLVTEADEILRNVKQEVEKANNEVDMILVHGGGSILLRKHLESKLQELCHKTQMKLFYASENYAVTLEARGLYEFSRTGLFQKMKMIAEKKNMPKFKNERE